MRKLLASAFVALALCSVSFAQEIPDHGFGKGRVQFEPLNGLRFSGAILTGTQGTVFDNNPWRSFSFSFDMAQLSVSLNEARTFDIFGTLKMSYNNYVWENSVYMRDVDNAPVPFPVPNCTKSKIRADYLGLPVGFRYHKDHLTVYATVSAELLTVGKTKYRYGNNVVSKENLYSINRFRSCLEVGVAYRSIGLFGSYSLTPVFNCPSADPLVADMKSFNFGLVWLW